METIMGLTRYKPPKGWRETMQDKIEELREKAARCRALADAQANVVAISELLALAFEYDSRAERLEAQFRARGSH